MVHTVPSHTSRGVVGRTPFGRNIEDVLINGRGLGGRRLYCDLSIMNTGGGLDQLKTRDEARIALRMEF